MNRSCIRLVALLGAVVVGTASAPVSAAEGAPARRPNIVLVVADDLGRADVGFMGAKVIKTPNLDALARGGAILDAFYVQPVCSPTRACLLTGRWAVRTGVYSVIRPGNKGGLPLEERTLAQALREAGYATAICGKWHLGEAKPAYRPTQRGFDRQYGHYTGAIDYFKHTRDGAPDWYRDDQPVVEEGYSTHLVAAEACKIVRETPAGKPLFLYVPFNGVHAPHQVPEKYLEPYGELKGERRTMAGMISAVDEAVGKIVAALREKGELENTFLVFTSDNGGPAPGRVTDNGPLRAGKGTLYEGGVRICAFVHGPGVQPGATIKETLHAVDLYPTLIRIGGGSLEQKLPLDGVDAVPVLTQGAKTPRDALLLAGMKEGDVALRLGDWKLIRHAPADEDAPAASPPKGAKQIRRASKGDSKSPELFNLAVDPNEKDDLAAAQPAKLKELSDRLDALLLGAVPHGRP